MHVLGGNRVNKLLQFHQQVGLSLEVVVVKLHPVAENVEDPMGGAHKGRGWCTSIKCILTNTYMWQSRVENLFRILIGSLRSKHCISEFPLRVGLIHAGQ